MKWLGALLIAAIAFGVTILSLHGGFRRFFSSAPTTQAVSTSDTNPSAISARPPESDPAKLLFRAIGYRDADQAIKILNEHPELAKKDKDISLLWEACDWGSLPVVKAFVEKGAKLDLKTSENKTILWIAVNSKHEDIVQYLIDKGADPKVLQDEDNNTLLWAAESKSMVELLIKAGVDPKFKNDAKDTALHKACRNCLVDVVAVLLDNGVGVETKGNWDMRPIHSSASSITADARPVLKLLLERGADIDSRGFKGRTALHECVLLNRYDNAVLLFSRGANPNVLDEEKKTALDIFGETGKSNRIKLYNLFVRNNAHGADGVPATIIPEPQQ